jgi:hypothetical protein
MEAIWVAVEMRAGGAFAHSTIALHTMEEVEHRTESRAPASIEARPAP